MEHCGSEGAMDFTIGEVTSDGSSSSSVLIPSFISLTSSLHLSHILITSSISSLHLSHRIPSFIYLIASLHLSHLSHRISSSLRTPSSISSPHHFIYLTSYHLASLHLPHHLASLHLSHHFITSSISLSLKQVIDQVSEERLMVKKSKATGL